MVVVAYLVDFFVDVLNQQFDFLCRGSLLDRHEPADLRKLSETLGPEGLNGISGEKLSIRILYFRLDGRNPSGAKSLNFCN